MKTLIKSTTESLRKSFIGAIGGNKKYTETQEGSKTDGDKTIIKKTSNFELLSRLTIEYLLPQKKNLAIVVALMLVVAGTTSLHAWLVKPALDKVFVEKNLSALIYIPIFVVLVTIVKAFATYFQLLMMNIFSLEVANRMRAKIYAHFIKSDLINIHQKSSGEMVAIIMNEVAAVNNLISMLLSGFIKQFFTIFGLVAVMFSQSVEFSLIAFIGFPLAVYPIYKIGKKLRNLSFHNQEVAQKFASQMSDSLQYAKLVKSYHCEDLEISRMHRIIEEIAKMGKKILRISLISSPFVEALAGIGVALVIWYGGSKVISGETTPGAFFSFFVAMMMAYRPIKSVSGMNSSVQMGLAATDRFYQMLAVKPKIVDNVDAINISNVRGDIKITNLNFSYNAGQPVINNFNLDIKAGMKVALVGHSGGGKSTIMQLLLRLYQSESGSITIDNHKIEDITISSLRGSMAVVNQEVMLFDDNIIENIRYGNVNATEEQVIEAAKIAEADEFIQKLPQKYYSKVGQNGILLSGGQRQRIAIARAVIKNASILLLDEATSSLDPISERLIKEALENLSKNKTAIIIAHRLSTVMNADLIAVINNGTVAEQGTHKELMSRNGLYAQLYSKQFAIDSEVETDSQNKTVLT